MQFLKGTKCSRFICSKESFNFKWQCCHNCSLYVMMEARHRRTTSVFYHVSCQAGNTPPGLLHSSLCLSTLVTVEKLRRAFVFAFEMENPKKSQKTNEGMALNCLLMGLHCLLQTCSKDLDHSQTSLKHIQSKPGTFLIPTGQTQ